MEDKLLKAISDKLTILIRLSSQNKTSESMTIEQILDLVDTRDLTDSEVANMFGVSAQSLRNARSKRGDGKK